MEGEKSKDWREYEKFIAEIFKEIDPTLQVKFDDLIEGRQIDVSIRKQIAGVVILIIIQAKWYKKAVPVGDVDAFESVIKETGASKGILIANKGFTRLAKEKAQKSKIELCSVHDSSKEKWEKPELLIPVVKTTALITLALRHEFNSEGGVVDKIGTKHSHLVAQEFVEKWINNKIPKTEGDHKIPLDEPAFIIPKTGFSIVSQPKTDQGISYFVYSIKYRHHFKKVHPDQYKGMLNYITANFTPSFLQFDNLSPFSDDIWEFVSNISDIAIKTSHVKADILQTDLYKIKMAHYEWVDSSL